MTTRATPEQARQAVDAAAAALGRLPSSFYLAPPMTPAQYASQLQKFMAAQIAHHQKGTDYDLASLDYETVMRGLEDAGYEQQGYVTDPGGFGPPGTSNLREANLWGGLQSIGLGGEDLSLIPRVDWDAIAKAPNLRAAIDIAGGFGLSHATTSQPLGPEEAEELKGSEMSAREFADALRDAFGGDSFERDDANSTYVYINYDLIANQDNLSDAISAAMSRDETMPVPLTRDEIYSVMSNGMDYWVAENQAANRDENAGYVDSHGTRRTLSIDEQGNQRISSAGDPIYEGFRPEPEDTRIGLIPNQALLPAQIPYGIQSEAFRQQLLTMDPADRATFGGLGGVQEKDRQYWEDDLQNFHLRWDSASTVAAYQARLMEAGLLNLGEFRPGVYDEPTTDQIRLLMISADDNGIDIEAMLDRFIEFPRPDLEDLVGDSTGFQPEVFRPKDISELVQTVKSTFREQLGREPRQGELDQFLGELASEYRQEHVASETAREASFTAGQDATNDRRDALEDRFISDPDAFLGGKVPSLDLPTPGDAAAAALADVPQINAYTRFLERFEAETAGERERKDRVEDAAARRDTIQSGLFRMTSLAGRRRVDPTLGR